MELYEKGSNYHIGIWRQEHVQEESTLKMDKKQEMQKRLGNP